MNLKLYFLVSLLFSICSISKTNGQQIRGLNYKPVDLSINKSLLIERQKQLEIENEKLIARENNAANFSSILPMPGKAEMIASDDHFNIYKLPLDNMPCLVPNEKYFKRMEAIKNRFNKSIDFYAPGNIPNALKKEEIIDPGN